MTDFKLGNKIRVTVDFRHPIAAGAVGIVSNRSVLRGDVIKVFFPNKSNWEMNFWLDEIEAISEEEYETGLLLES
jgi:hypothetical protein